MNVAAEQCLQATILPKLEDGRQDWDRPHTELVVVYAKDIVAATDLELDEEVIVTAAYGHDWGYTGLFSNGPPDLTQTKTRKAEHMKRGAEKMADLLERPEFAHLSRQQKGRICHLILVHDMVEYLRSPDELVLMEADTLAGFDDRVASTYSPEEKTLWKIKALDRRVSRFVTDYSRAKIEELVELYPIPLLK